MNVPSPPQRPLGVTLLSLLFWAEGVCTLAAALLFVGSALFASSLLLDASVGAGVAGMVLALFVGLLIGGIGVLYCLEGHGLWRLRPWARTVAIVLAVLAIVPLALLCLLEIGIAVVGGAAGLVPVAGLAFAAVWIGGHLLALALPALILWYLCTAEIAAAFRQPGPFAEADAYADAWPGGDEGQIAAAPTAAGPRCTNPACGRELRGGWTHCPYCRGILTPALVTAGARGAGRCPNPRCGRAQSAGWRVCPYCRGVAAATVGVAGHGRR
jgi:hypothetical protein